MPFAAWNNFHKHAHRVLEVYWSEDRDSISSQVFAKVSERVYLTRPSAGDDLLPRTRSFCADCKTVDGLRGILPWLSRSLTKLELNITPSLDDELVTSCLSHVKERCCNLRSFGLSLNNDSFSQCRSRLIALSIPSSLTSLRLCITGPDADDNAVTSLLLRIRDQCPLFTSLFLTIPLEYLPDTLDFLTESGWLRVLEVSMLPPSSSNLLSQVKDHVKGRMEGVIRSSRQLWKLSLPADVVSTSLLVALSELPDLRELVFSSGARISSSLISRWDHSRYICFSQLRIVSIPLDCLSDTFLDCLAQLPNLEEFVVSSATSPVAADATYRRATSYGEFAVLRSLQVSGNMAECAKMIRACVYAKAQDVDTKGDHEVGGLQRLHLFTQSLQHRKDMPNVLEVIAIHCPTLKELTIDIQNIHMGENADWMDLMPSRRLGMLETIRIRHPHPLPLPDNHIYLMLRAWPSAKHISLNPRPSLRPWKIEGYYKLPTLLCLSHVAKEGRLSLRHFAVYMNPYVACKNMDDAVSLRTLKELDLGNSGDSKRDNVGAAALLLRLFPMAKFVTEDTNSLWWTRQVAGRLSRMR